MPPRVLVLGGGFSAVGVCRSLKRDIAKGRLDVTVVSRENSLCVHGLIPEMITGRVSPGTILNPARRIFSGAKVHVAEVAAIDLEAKRVTTMRQLDGARFELEYDHAVVALGTAENLDLYPGLAEHAFKLKSFDDCFALKNHLIEMFELADIETDPEERKRLLTFFVAGGGFSGTEMAGEMADFARLLTKREFNGIRRDECRVVIVHPGKTLLPELYGAGSEERKDKAFPKLIAYGTKHAEKLGVELMLETKVVGATPNEVHLSNGERIPTRTIISAVGTKPSPVVSALPLDFDPRGRIVVDECMRVAGHDGLWAVGDCAAVHHPRGGTCPPTVLWARVEGRHLGKNLRRVVAGQEPKPFRKQVRMQGISIGRRTGVGEMLGIQAKGKPAWLGFRSVALIVIPSWDRKLRALSDWLIWPFVGRDIALMKQGGAPNFDVRQFIFASGEVLAERARPVRHVHVIVEGHADVVKASGGQETAVAKLGPGDYFGRKWLEQLDGDLVRSTSMVKTVALRADQANVLQDALLRAEPIVAATGLHTALDPAVVEQLRSGDLVNPSQTS
jgi:NADH dehydrogenase